ncbi:hypothetical protein [Novosphingobium sp. FSW06-99]|uniref:hypothetical protein n=1 Tax=Novosphingobium sp. FSW06-99 TaxID=1739113 RepID=UPI00076D52BB|nr:hypothetical protein [Novosphingobium sp. FSW06-99]KUR80795.1 hypothetical protein AQZ49_01840 [Novosphingobium sp. FSW06-99]
MRFQPQLQCFRHDPESGVYGDCYRTAVAMCLGVPRDQVPHFCSDPERDSPDREWANRRDAWLASHGMCVIEIPWPDLDVLIAQSGLSFGEGAVTVSGYSPRGTLHECVIYKGRLFDPHPDGGGLIAPHDDGHYWSHIFTRRLA